VARSFECRHGGVVCGARITGDSDEEVFQKALEHARTKHGVDLARSTTLSRYLKSLIREA
jgi:predicted small metal-binding protein